MKLDEIPENQEWTYDKIKEAYHATPHTISQIAKRFVTGGLEAALGRKEQANRHRKIDGRVEAHIIAIACSEAPEGRERWTLQLIADELVRLGVVDSISDTAVMETLKNTNLSLGKKGVVHPKTRGGVCSEDGGRSGLYISVLMILCARWSAWMRRTGSLLRSGGFRRNLEVQGERIMNTAAAVW